MVMRSVEKALGLPRLSEVSETLEGVNNLLQNLDVKRLEILKRVLEVALKLQTQGGVQQLQDFSAIIQIVANTDMEKLDKIQKTISDIKATVAAVQRLIKSLPVDAFEKLHIEEITAEIRKALAQ